MMVEIQKGLFLEARSFVVNGVFHYNSILHSADGYCFYDKTEEIYDEERNLVTDVKPTQRRYMRGIITPITSIEELNSIYVSLPIEDNFEIL